MWFLIISENNLPGPQQQRSKVPFDPTPRTKILLRNSIVLFCFFFYKFPQWSGALLRTRHSGKREALLLTWGATAALTRQLMPFTCPFQNASLRTVEYKGGSGRSERGSRAAQIRPPQSWRRGRGKGGVSSRLPLSPPCWVNFKLMLLSPWQPWLPY